MLPRQRSVADAQVLRRKGRLQEQDPLIEFMMGMHATHSSPEVMAKVEGWIGEHIRDPRRSALCRLVPGIGRFLLPLNLVAALEEYDDFGYLSQRKYVRPNFAEIRHVLNIAQVHAVSPSLGLLTFDADGTLYEDGAHIEEDSEMIDRIVALLSRGVKVAIVTAAGYTEEAAFEGRIAGLLLAFQSLPRDVWSKFFVMGGECNYLLRVERPGTDKEGRGGDGMGPLGLEFIPEAEWKSPEMLAWSEEDITQVLDQGQAALLEAADRMKVEVQLVRKERSVGVVPMSPTVYECLEEITLAAQVQLGGDPSNIPHCAFNGGGDCFVDVGNKGYGIDSLMRMLEVEPLQVMHVGDRFTVTGNDAVAKSKFGILWVANPDETNWYLSILQNDIDSQQAAGSVAPSALKTF